MYTKKKKKRVIKCYIIHTKLYSTQYWLGSFCCENESTSHKYTMRNGEYLRNLGCIGTNGKFPTSGILERDVGKDISSLGMDFLECWNFHDNLYIYIYLPTNN